MGNVFPSAGEIARGQPMGKYIQICKGKSKEATDWEKSPHYHGRIFLFPMVLNEVRT
jgi:hypothetical protein